MHVLPCPGYTDIHDPRCPHITDWCDMSFDEVVANFEQQVNPLPVDIGHSSLTFEEDAVGWVHKLQRRGDDLVR